MRTSESTNWPASLQPASRKSCLVKPLGETRGEQYSLVSGVCLSVSQSVSLPFLIMRVRPVRAKAAQSHKAILSRRSHVRIYSVSLVFLRLLSLSPSLTHTLFLTHARNPLRDRRSPPPPSPSEDAANVGANNDFKMRRDALDSPMNPSINSGIQLKRTKTKQLTHREVEGKKSCPMLEQNPLG